MRFWPFFLFMTISCTTSQDELVLKNNEEDSETTETVDAVDATPVTQKSSENTSKDKSINKVTTPFSKSLNLFEYEKFMTLQKGLYERFLPLESEYNIYYKTLTQSEEIDEEMHASVVGRVKEDTDKAHWVWTYAINELLHFLHDHARNMLRVDLEDNFAERMKIISQIALVFKETQKNEKYVEFSRALYISINDRYFGRVVKPRTSD